MPICNLGRMYREKDGKWAKVLSLNNNVYVTVCSNPSIVCKGEMLSISKYKTSIGRKTISDLLNKTTSPHVLWSHIFPGLNFSFLKETLTNKYYPGFYRQFRWRLIYQTMYHPHGISVCCRCNNSYGDNTHIISECPFARQVWKLFEDYCNLTTDLRYRIFGPKTKENKEWKHRNLGLIISKMLWNSYWKEKIENVTKDSGSLFLEASIEYDWYRYCNPNY